MLNTICEGETMEIRIIFEAENAAFCDKDDGNFDEEIKRVMKQATEFIIGDMHSDGKLKDINGNVVGSVWCSTARRP